MAHRAIDKKKSQIQKLSFKNREEGFFYYENLSIGFDLGFVLWELRRYALSALRYALFRKIPLPDLLNPIDQLSEFIKKGHLVEIVFE